MEKCFWEISDRLCVDVVSGETLMVSVGLIVAGVHFGVGGAAKKRRCMERGEW